MKTAGPVAFDDLKKGLSESLDDLQQAFERARSRFEERKEEGKN